MSAPLFRTTLALSLLLAACATDDDADPDVELEAERAAAPDELDLDVEDGDPAVDLAPEPELTMPAGARVIEGAGVRAVAPPPGMSVHASVIFTDGTTSELIVSTALDGTVTTRSPEQPPIEEGDAARAGAKGACNDDFWIGLIYEWDHTYRWALNTGTRPAGLSVAAVEGAVRRATSHITGASNSCGMKDNVSAAHVYRGRTKARAGITAGGGCTSNDGRNVTDWGNLPANVLALTCTWHSGVDAVESDARMNKADHAWYVTKPSGCKTRYDIEAVMTHERGHTYGLADLTVENHPNLTMRGAIRPCDGRTRTLGKGDVLGLRNKY